jgi:two-component system, chemotaxis family, chemotaxis protein CheY
MSKMILIVEDSDNCAETLQIALETLHQVEVCVVNNAQSAWEIMAETPGRVAAIVTDLQMPHMSGIEFLQQIRSSAEFASVPVVVVSGNTEPGLEARVLSLGANGFFPKPFSPMEVRNTLEHLLR